MMPDRDCVAGKPCKKQTEWGCSAKAHPVFDDNNEPVIDPTTKKQKVEWSNPSHEPYTFDNGEEWWACPRQDIFENSRDWARMMLVYSLFKKGHLPDPGSIMDQSHRAITILNIVDSVNEECSFEIRQRDAANLARAR